MKNILAFLTFFAFLLPMLSIAETKEAKFDAILMLTQQDIEMNWWFYVPSEFHPRVSEVEEVIKGERFKVLPIFNNCGVSDDNQVHITYDVTILKPNGGVYNSSKKVMGFKGAAPGPYLLPSQGMLAVSFDPGDPYGEYSVNVTIYDHVKNEEVTKSKTVKLKEYIYQSLEEQFNEWFLSYPAKPKPSLALAAYVNSPRHYIDEKGHPLWSGLWFYKYVYAENDFLILHTIDYFKTKATMQQKKDITLLFHLIDKVGRLPLDDGLRGYLSDIVKIKIPDPYEEIRTGDQLDMLWAESFATARVKPLRQIVTALNLSKYRGTLDKVRSGELEMSAETKEHVMLEAVYSSAIWSIMSNCKQSPLHFQYFVGLYKYAELNDTEKSHLGAMLKKVSEEKRSKEKSDDE